MTDEGCAVRSPDPSGRAARSVEPGSVVFEAVIVGTAAEPTRGAEPPVSPTRPGWGVRPECGRPDRRASPAGGARVGGGVQVSIAGPGRLGAAVRHRPGGITVAFQGDLDAAAEPMARALLWACLDECVRALVVDLTGVFVDVRGFTVLHLLWRAGRERGVRVALAECSPVVDRMVTVLTPQGVPRFRTVDAAWQAVTSSGPTTAAPAATAG